LVYSRYKRNASAVFLYVTQNSDDFHIFFPSELLSKTFYDLVHNMVSVNCEASDKDDVDSDPSEVPIQVSGALLAVLLAAPEDCG